MKYNLLQHLARLEIVHCKKCLTRVMTLQSVNYYNSTIVGLTLAISGPFTEQTH